MVSKFLLRRKVVRKSKSRIPSLPVGALGSSRRVARARHNQLIAFATLPSSLLFATTELFTVINSTAIINSIHSIRWM